MSPRPVSAATSSIISIIPKSGSICPTCAFSRAFALANATRTNTYRQRATPTITPRRHASTVVSSTAVNATRQIPPNVRKLYESLEGLKKRAPNFVNLSKLQLALRSLGSVKPTIRVAVLGLQNQDTARRLSRLLLADVLSEQGDWESKLDASSQYDTRALLLRYGDATDALPSNSQLATLLIPSRVLQQHNLEVLVSSLNIADEAPAGVEDARGLRRAALVPMAQAQTSFAGGVSLLTYPVHRAIIVGDGLPGCVTLGRYSIKGKAGVDGTADIPMHIASNFPELAGVVNRDAPDKPEISIIDVSRAENAVAKFRESISNASIYERQWNDSGLPRVTQWLSSGFDPEETQTIDPSLRALIGDLTSDVSENITADEEARLQQLTQPAIVDDARQPLNESLKIWAERAHVELLEKLDDAFQGEKWAKLRWWKLAWRVDDVTMITTELIDRSWLVEAEKGIIWLSGRSAQAGLHDEINHKLALQPPARPATAANKKDASIPRREQESVAGDSASGDTSPLSALPWPMQIPLARQALQAATIPTLQSLAQALLLQAISITTLTSALSALVYISFPASTLYSSGAIAALGVAWSLRRVQRTWEEARASWEGDTRESGRVVLKQVEEGFREMLRARKSTQTGAQDTLEEDSKLAREAVDRVSDALDEISESQKTKH